MRRQVSMRLIGLVILALYLALAPLAVEAQETPRVWRIGSGEPVRILRPTRASKPTIPQSLLLRADEVIEGSARRGARRNGGGR
jgi:hypothetical protein